MDIEKIREKIMAREPCDPTGKRVAGFLTALEAGDVKALAEYNLYWVAEKCFTLSAKKAFQKAFDLAWTNFKLQVIWAAEARAFLVLAQKDENWE